MTSYNDHLEPLPDDNAVLAALAACGADTRYRDGVTAQGIAYKCGVQGARRLGRGAQGPHSWSGYMAPALRMAPRLRRLVRLGLVGEYYDPEPGARSRKLYYLTAAGRQRLAVVAEGG